MKIHERHGGFWGATGKFLPLGSEQAFIDHLGKMHNDLKKVLLNVWPKVQPKAHISLSGRQAGRDAFTYSIGQRKFICVS